jgi:hypothetical protein
MGLIVYLATWVVRCVADNANVNFYELPYPKEIIEILKLSEADVFDIDPEQWASKEDVAMII